MPVGDDALVVEAFRGGERKNRGRAAWGNSPQKPRGCPRIPRIKPIGMPSFGERDLNGEKGRRPWANPSRFRNQSYPIGSTHSNTKRKNYSSPNVISSIHYL